MNRPPVTLSMTVADFASIAGWRNVLAATAMPIHLPGHAMRQRRDGRQRLHRRAVALPAGVRDVVAHPAGRRTRRSSPASAHVSSMRGQSSPVDSVAEIRKPTRPGFDAAVIGR